MGRVISFEERAVARLRDRLGEAETARADLLAFARGHSGAVASIHRAVLAGLEADSSRAIADRRDLRLAGNARARFGGADTGGRRPGVSRRYAARSSVIARPIVNRAMQSLGAVELRNVERGHALFGEAAEIVRSEALIRIDSPSPLPYGLLLLGQQGEQALDTPSGADLLLFLGSSLAAMIRRWTLSGPVHDLAEHPARALAARWDSFLAHDRRRSPHTVRAYVATAHRFIDFLGSYRGEEIGRFGLLNVAAADLRAFLAERRGNGLGPSSAAREMSAVRAFLTFAAEEAGNIAQLPRTRAPKRPRTLPRPASPADAMALGRRGRGGRDRLGRRTRHGDPAVALRVGIAGRGSDGTDRQRAADRADAARDRQARQDAGGAGGRGGAAGDRDLCAGMPVAAGRADAVVRRGRAAGRSMPIWCGARCAGRGPGWGCPTA